MQIVKMWFPGFKRQGVGEKERGERDGIKDKAKYSLIILF